jgi:hypothetical protein
MKGAVSKIIMVLAAIMVSIFLFVVVSSSIGGPAVDVYGDHQARMVSRSVAASINALSSVDEGRIVISRFLPGGTWDLSVREREDKSGMLLTVSHSQYSSSADLYGEVEPVENVYDARGIVLNKEEGGPVRLTKKL